MQDLTGVPAVVDLASMRDAIIALGGDAEQDQSARARRTRHRPLRDPRAHRHRRRATSRTSRSSTSATSSATPSSSGPRAPSTASASSLRAWASVTRSTSSTSRAWSSNTTAWPIFDTVVGTDSHTTMVNGLGVLGWGVGGIEAEAGMLGQPASMLIPPVVGLRLIGRAARRRHRDRRRAHHHRAAAPRTASSASSSRRTDRASSRSRSKRGPPLATCRPSTARPARSSRSTR